MECDNWDPILDTLEDDSDSAANNFNGRINQVATSLSISLVEETEFSTDWDDNMVAPLGETLGFGTQVFQELVKLLLYDVNKKTGLDVRRSSRRNKGKTWFLLGDGNSSQSDEF